VIILHHGILPILGYCQALIFHHISRVVRSFLFGFRGKMSYGGAGGGSKYGANDKLLQVQGQTAELITVARENVNKAIARGESIDELDKKAEDLERGAGQFRANATQVRRMFCCRSARNTLIIVFLILVVLLLILWAAGAFNKT